MHSFLQVFRYGKLPAKLDKITVFSGLLLAGLWLYFALIRKEFVLRVFTGQTVILDLLIGLPIVLAFGIMVYAIVIWSVKILLMIMAPNLITMPDMDEYYRSFEEGHSDFEPLEKAEDFTAKRETNLPQNKHSDEKKLK